MDTRTPQETAMTFEQIREMFQTIGRKQEETDRQMKETDRKISRLGSRLGELIEDLTASNLVEKVNAEGYRFTKISRNNTIKDEKNKLKAEIDILLEDGDYAMVVEVKTNLTKADVKEHLQRMDTLRRHADAHGDKRKYVSSVAGALIKDGAKEYALEQGLYVIEHPGQTIEIVAPPQKREW
jgi:hypothetical protein